MKIQPYEVAVIFEGYRADQTYPYLEYFLTYTTDYSEIYLWDMNMILDELLSVDKQ